MTIRAARIEDAAALVQLFEDWNHALPEAAIADRLAEWERTPLAAVLGYADPSERQARYSREL